MSQRFDAVNTDLKDVYKGLGSYSKALDKADISDHNASRWLADRFCRNLRISHYLLPTMTLFLHTPP